MDSIRVGIRVRPLLAREKNGVKWVVRGENAIVPTTPGSAGFEFDHVFGESSTTDQLYTTITLPIVHSVMQGFNGTVFAYGQTSSGKTFTMMGTEAQPGVIPLAIQEIFDYMEEHEESEFIVRVSYIEIYKEGIYDLLDPASTDLKIREDRDNNVRVHGIKEYPVTNIEEVTRVIFIGNINRTTGETNMNERSSRSHAVLSTTVESRIKNGDGTVKVASLNLVDLAGSERLKATGAAGKRAQEGIAINKSLFTLKQVISKLSEGNPSVHIPYRDSKLTHILKPSLGGNAKTAIICAVTPAESYETELTLNFAICAMKVKNRPIVNEVLGGEEALKKKLRQLERENGELRGKLSSSESSLTDERRKELIDQIEEKESRQSELEARIHSLEEIIIKSKTHRDSAGGVAGATGGKCNRRKTICPASLARGMGSPLIIALASKKPRHSVTPVVTPEVTHRSVTRIKKEAHFSTPLDTAENFQSFFNSSGFERELDTEMVDRQTMDDNSTLPPTVLVRDLERRRTMFRFPTFVVDTPASAISMTGDQTVWHQEGDGEPPPYDQPTSTDDNASLARQATVTDAYTQTEEWEAETEGTAIETEGTAMETGGTAIETEEAEASFVFNRRQEMNEYAEYLKDELDILREDLAQAQVDLQSERDKSRGLEEKLKEMTTKLSDMEMASAAQEEYLTKLCQQSKAAAHRQGDLEDKCSQLERELEKHAAERDGWEVEREGMVSEACVLREQLQHLHSELEKLPSDRRRCSEPPISSEERQQLTALMDKLHEAELAREKEAEAFQNSYQQKVHELQKAQEVVCYLQEQLEETQATPTNAPLTSEESGMEDLQRVTEELRMREGEMEDQEVVIAGLQSQLSAATEDAAVVQTDLKAQLQSVSEELTEARAHIQEHADLKTQLEAQVESLTSQLNQLQDCLKVRSSASEQAELKVSELQTQLEDVSQQLHQALSRIQVISEQAELKVSELQTQLEDMSQQLHQALCQIQEKDGKLGTLEEEVEELKKKEETLYSQIAECADDYISQIGEKELAWQEERDELHKKLEAKQHESQVHLEVFDVASEVAELKVSELQTQLEDVSQQLHQALCQIQEKDGKLGTLEEEVEELKKKEETLYSQIAECADDYINQIGEKELAWQEERDKLHKKLEAAQQQSQEKDGKLGTLEEEVEELKKKEETLYSQIAECADDYISQIGEKGLAWQEERDELHKKSQAQTEIIARLQAQVSSLQRQVAQIQRVQPPCPVALAEAERKVKDLLEQNERLKSQVQAQMTFQPSLTSAGALCCDSSGTITSAALYHLRGEVKKLQEDKAKAEGRVDKLKNELQKRMELYTREQEELNRYRTERNVFRAKYLDLKERHAALVSQTESSAQANSTSSQPPTSNPSRPPTSQPPTSQLPTSQSANVLSQLSTSQPPTSQLPIFQPPTSQPTTSQLPIFQPPTSLPHTSLSQPPTSQLPIFQPPTSLSKPPVASLPTPKTNPRRSFFSYIPPPNPQPAWRPPHNGHRPPVMSQKLPQGGSSTTGENVPLTKQGTGGNSSSAPQGTNRILSPSQRNSVPLSADVGEQLWDMSIIQTAPLPSGGQSAGHRDQDKCHQQ